MIQRILKEQLTKQIFKGKAIVLMGSRQTGKTSLLAEIFPSEQDALWLSGDDVDVQGMMENMTAQRMRMLLGDRKAIVIDEAQRIKDIGLRMKVITDQMKDVQLVATGSSAFELANRLNEPLTGRKWEYQLYPLSFAEMVAHHGLLTEKRLLTHRLVYGYYPEVVTSTGNERNVLKMLSDSYMYKDVLAMGNIKKSDKLLTLLQAIAFQVGDQVSYSELASTVGIDVKTVESYIDVLEKCYIIFRLPSLSRNLRNELKNNRKIYFYDNGIRNALISNFSQMELRTDSGALWENFAISERIKFTAYNQLWCNRYFWRTHEQKEIDYVEDSDGILSAFEFKYNPKKKVIVPKHFAEAYPDAKFKVITPDNFEEFVLGSFFEKYLLFV
jgi:predicted AAA+ superfamily ATPase